MVSTRSVRFLMIKEEEARDPPVIIEDGVRRFPFVERREVHAEPMAVARSHEDAAIQGLDEPQISLRRVREA